MGISPSLVPLNERSDVSSAFGLKKNCSSSSHVTVLFLGTNHKRTLIVCMSLIPDRSDRDFWDLDPTPIIYASSLTSNQEKKKKKHKEDRERPNTSRSSRSGGSSKRHRSHRSHRSDRHYHRDRHHGYDYHHSPRDKYRTEYGHHRSYRDSRKTTPRGSGHKYGDRSDTKRSRRRHRRRSSYSSSGTSRSPSSSSPEPPRPRGPKGSSGSSGPKRSSTIDGFDPSKEIKLNRSRQRARPTPRKEARRKAKHSSKKDESMTRLSDLLIQTETMPQPSPLLRRTNSSEQLSIQILRRKRGSRHRKDKRPKRPKRSKDSKRSNKPKEPDNAKDANKPKDPKDSKEHEEPAASSPRVQFKDENGEQANKKKTRQDRSSSMTVSGGAVPVVGSVSGGSRRGRTSRSSIRPAHNRRHSMVVPSLNLREMTIEEKKEKGAKISLALRTMLTAEQRAEMERKGETTIPNFTADGKRARSKDFKRSLLKNTSSMGTFKIETKARTFSVVLDNRKIMSKKIRGVYVSVDDVALLYLQDLIRALSDMDLRTGKARSLTMYSSYDSEDSDDSGVGEGEEYGGGGGDKHGEDEEEREARTVAQLLKKIPDMIQGIDVVYYRGSEKETTVAPEGTFESHTSTALSKANSVYESLIRTPMMRASDVYERLLSEASVHRQRYVFGLISCLEPYVPDDLLVSAVRNVQKQVAADFRKRMKYGEEIKGPKGATMIPGCVFTRTRCAYLEEVGRVKNELEEQKESRRQAWKVFSETNANLTAANEANQKYSEMAERLLKDKEEYGLRILDLQKVNKNLKTMIHEQEKDLEKHEMTNRKLLAQLRSQLDEKHSK